MPAGRLYRPFGNPRVVRANRLRKKVVPVKIVSKRKPTKRNKRNILINRGPSLIPDMYMTKMKFTKVIRTTLDMSLQTGVDTDPNQVYSAKFSGNSIYDSDLDSLTNNWPVGYAEFRNFYERFYVRGCRINVTAISKGGDLTMGYRSFILPSNRDGIDGIPVNSLSGNPYATRIKYFGPAFGENITRMQTKMTTSAITGRGKPVREQNFHGKMSGVAVNGNPEIEWFYHVILQGTNQQFPPEDFELTVQLTYDVMFYQRRQQIQDNPNTLGDLDEEILDANGPTGGGPPTEF